MPGPDGPSSMKNEQVMQLLARAFPLLDQQFTAGQSSEAASAPPSGNEQAGAERVLAAVAERMGDNYPYFHPLYAGQMLKPPHPVARAAYALAMAINPNNHALDGGRASSRMEIEAVAAIAQMFGLEQHLGHLTSGGTFANLEALWVAGQLAPAAAIIASDQAHYTHQRISAVLKLPFETTPTDNHGRMDIAALETRLIQGEEGHRRKVGTVVVTLGTTAVGSVDPLTEVLRLRERHGFRIHVDAAYGGYFKLASNLSGEATSAYEAIRHADSVVIDPHKHGLQPYGCGCVLFCDPSVGRFYKHDSPYTYFSSEELHLGEISLECSRAGASAVALWATQQFLPMERGGAFAADLERCRSAAVNLFDRLKNEPIWVPAFAPELDIVVWAVRADSIEESSALARRVFDRAAELGLHLALAALPFRFFPAGTWPIPPQVDENTTVLCLRSVLMKPEHAAWMPRIWGLLGNAAGILSQ
jgi:tyrosine decarboxylase / aspartate 1-decarboxylase